VTFDRTSGFHPHDFIGFEFDNDNDGIREDGDDIVLAGAGTPQNVAIAGGDYYRFNGGTYNGSDVGGGGTIDAVSAWGAIGTTGVFEIRHPLNSGPPSVRWDQLRVHRRRATSPSDRLALRALGAIMW